VTTRPQWSEDNLQALAAQAAHCRRCPLYRDATQLVFGEGAANALLFLVGEMPGDREDLSGLPFVGPAGKMLDKAFAEAGLKRETIYLTNAVKHFKHEMRGKRRLHKHPDRYEVEQCRWWLDRELAAVEPALVVALGGVAAGALMGRAVTLAKERGRLLRWRDGRRGMATIHPSLVLRLRDSARRETEFKGLVDDLRKARKLSETLAA
jgi:uracil-DNA glycosylase